MNINAPTTQLYPGLKSLWQQAFGDPMPFIDGFFETGFSPDRCRCLTEGGQVAAALYWFDAEFCGEKFAYIYAVATEKTHRGQGLCRQLMENTHAHLQRNGYSGAVLVPAEDGLWDYYNTMGYRKFGGVRKFTANAGGQSAPLEEITATQYSQSREAYLTAPLNEANAIAFYGTWGKFYRGPDFLLAAARDERLLYVQEFLGNPEKAPAAVAALGCDRGQFRTVGNSEPCGMYLLFKNISAPAYLGFPLD